MHTCAIQQHTQSASSRLLIHEPMGLSANYSRTFLISLQTFGLSPLLFSLCARDVELCFLVNIHYDCVGMTVRVSEVEVYITLRDKSDFDGFTEAVGGGCLSATAAPLIQSTSNHLNLVRLLSIIDDQMTMALMSHGTVVPS